MSAARGQLKDYPAYLFDLDGTLIDSAPDIHRALNVTLLEFGMAEVDEAMTRLWVGHGSRRLLQSAIDKAPDCGYTEPDQAMLDCFMSYYNAHIADHSQPYDGVREALSTLNARGAKLAVVTNKYLNLSLSVLEQLSLIDEFVTVVGHESSATPKPAPDPALLACERLGVMPGDALFVGDAPPDVGCARAAGCEVVVVSYGYNMGVDPHELGGDAVIDSLTELL